jgi:hypothetical protein
VHLLLLLVRVNCTVCHLLLLLLVLLPNTECVVLVCQQGVPHHACCTLHKVSTRSHHVHCMLPTGHTTHTNESEAQLPPVNDVT